VLVWSTLGPSPPTSGHHASSHGGLPDEAAASGGEWEGAARFLASTRAAIARFADVAVATEAGFLRGPGAPGRPLHYYPHVEHGRDGAVLDPARPEGLVYLETLLGPALMGAVFTASPAEAGPAPGGRLTPWHVHAPGCHYPDHIAGCALVPGLRMLHVWTFEYAVDPFGPNLGLAVEGRDLAPRLAALAGDG
ncbi:MAG: hypothetical protein ACRD0M_06850, partial [Acidimicrobiales bacterium]